MSESVLKYQCPACGAPLEFSAKKQMLVCGSCDNEYPEDFVASAENSEETLVQNKIDWNLEGYVKEQTTTPSQSGFSCTSCGAEIVSDAHTVATECMYCGNPVVMKDNVSGMVTPDTIIPFKIDKKTAEQMLKDFYKGKLLLPDAFTSNNRVSKISGLYVPFWFFSCIGSGSVTFEATKVKHWSDDDYDYTKTEYYQVYRSGQIGFNQIPVDASSKMEDNYMDGIEPFDYKELEQFSPKYMAGYFGDKFDVNVEDSAERASKRVISSTEQAFENTVTGYTTVTKKHSFVKMKGEDITYAMLPVWMLNTKYQGQMYQFAINGQTGQVAGELPIDKAKLLKYRVLITLISAIPIAAITLLFI